jgi:L-alanine-DL-glutamate epimerase-like enolase superfamily enzyme
MTWTHRHLAGFSRGDGRSREAYRAEGYHRFQLKVCGDPTPTSPASAAAARLQPGDRLVADANTGWLMHEAMRVALSRR